MTAFWLCAAGLCLVAWLMLVLPGRSRGQARTASANSRDEANLAVLREQSEALDRELAEGRMDAEEHGRARAELEQRTLEETAEASPRRRIGRAMQSARAEVLLGLGIVMFAFGVYGWLGEPDAAVAPEKIAAAPGAPAASTPPGPAAAPGAATAASGSQAFLQPGATPAGGGGAASPEAVGAMVDEMAKRMEAEPTGSVDAASWALVGRSYAAMQRFDAASRAYKRALALAPDDAQLLADQADVLSMLQGGRTAGEPAQLIERALKSDPRNAKALSLAGSDAFQRRDFAVAMARWAQARELAPPGLFAEGLERSMGEARAAMAQGPDAASLLTAKTAPTAPASEPASAAARGVVAGRVRLAPELAAKVRPDDTVFVFARALEGPPMPVAIARYTASELPLAFSLDDRSSMAGGPRLSSVERVVIRARISRSGNAAPRSGDLRGESPAVVVGRTDVDVVIGSVLP